MWSDRPVSEVVVPILIVGSFIYGKWRKQEDLSTDGNTRSVISALPAYKVSYIITTHIKLNLHYQTFV